MSLAISFGDFEDPNSVSGAVYFNATTSYSRKYAGKVSEHPLEVGVKVSDHFSSDNNKFSISGVISGVEISYVPSGVLLDGQPVINNQSEPPIVTAGAGAAGGLMSYIPEVVTQFLPPMNSLSMSMSSDSRDNKAPEIEDLLNQLMTGVYYNESRNKWENRMTPVTLYELDGYFITRTTGNLVITDFTVNEDAESGEGMFFNMSLEQVRFVTLDDAEAPTPAANSDTAAKTSPDKNKGSPPATKPDKVDVPSPPPLEPQ